MEHWGTCWGIGETGGILVEYWWSLVEYWQNLVKYLWNRGYMVELAGVLEYLGGVFIVVFIQDCFFYTFTECTGWRTYK